jgi:hypothetical protein
MTSSSVPKTKTAIPHSDIRAVVLLYYDPKTANLGTVHDDALTLKVFPQVLHSKQ